MEANGWTFNDITEYWNNVYGQCKANRFWGYKYGAGGGSSVTAVLKGSGTANLQFGNCKARGNVKVYINDLLLGDAKRDTSLSATFTFSEDDILTITEDNAIMQLHSFEVACGKNKQFVGSKIY